MSFFKKISNKLTSLKFFFKKRYFVAQYKVFSGDEWLETSVYSIADHVHKILFVVSDVAWGDEIYGDPAQGDRLNTVLKSLENKYPGKVLIQRGTWNSQKDHVQAGLEFIREHIKDATHCLYVDSDEIYEESELRKLKKTARNYKSFNREVRVNMFTYFKSPKYQVFPPENFKPMVLFPIRHFVEYTGIRSVNLAFIEADIWFHHLSYVRKEDVHIRNKMITHKHDEGTDVSWYDDVYLKWTPETTNFHPKEPAMFKTVKILKDEEVLPLIRDTYDSWNI